MKKIICLYGGPGTGKSTMCAGIFFKLKQQGYDVEMNREYVKEWVWENREVKPGDQTYFFAKQSRKERIYMEKDIEYIITDSPLVLTHFYGLKNDEFERKFNTSLAMLKHHHEVCKKYRYKVEHFMLNRVKPFKPKGRFETEEQAIQFDKDIKKMLVNLNIKHVTVNGDEGGLDEIIKHLNKQNESSNS